MEKTIHMGRNIKRFREMLGVKQDSLAFDMNLSQQAISALEQKEVIDDSVLQQVAQLLKVPKEAIKNFDEDQVINIISNTVNNTDNANGNSLFSYYPTINPIEKWMEALEENRKLYERLLEAEKEKNSLLQKLMEERK